MHIANMTHLTQMQLTQAAQILTDSLPLGWATLSEALKELDESLAPANTLLAVLDENDVIGWGGIFPRYDGRVFEMHPICVREDMRGHGVGAMLVRNLENAAAARGALTMLVCADDDTETGETSLAGADLYFNLPAHMMSFEPHRHSSAFYMHLGYTLVGVVPDANGPGKPDIYLAKKL